jgi:hypothetical protein
LPLRQAREEGQELISLFSIQVGLIVKFDGLELEEAVLNLFHGIAGLVKKHERWRVSANFSAAMFTNGSFYLNNSCTVQTLFLFSFRRTVFLDLTDEQRENNPEK